MQYKNCFQKAVRHLQIVWPYWSQGVFVYAFNWIMCKIVHLRTRIDL